MKYYYLLVSGYVDFYDVLYGDLERTDYAKHKDNYQLQAHTHLYRMMRICGLLSHTRITNALSSFVRAFYLKPYFKELLAGIPQDRNRYCFLLPPYIIYMGADQYIRKKYPDSKLVCLYTNPVASPDYDWRTLLTSTQEKTDLLYTYDGGDARKYNMKFINLPCSDLAPYVAGIDKKYDLSFVGQDKGRLSDVIHICKNLKSRGFTCNFHLVKVPAEKQVAVEGIHYHDDFLSFVECIKISASSKCILELIQPGSQGNTTRVAESISLGRKLLSANPNIVTNGYFVPGNMLYFQTIEEVPDEFFLTEYIEVSEEVRNRIRPETFIRHIEDDLIELDKQKGSE